MRTSAIAIAAMLIASAAIAQVQSGLQVGDVVPPFDIKSVCGPDKGKVSSVR